MVCRRRLSVVSDNKLIEGIATIGASDAEETLSHMGEHVVKAYAGVSKKGYAPYNPRKRNQDAILMEEHKSTGTIIFGVFDGHGEAGDLVSHYFSERIPSRLVANPKFASDPGTAMADDLDRLEKQLLAGALYVISITSDGGRASVQHKHELVHTGRQNADRRRLHASWDWPRFGSDPIRCISHLVLFQFHLQMRASTQNSAAAPALSARCGVAR